MGASAGQRHLRRLGLGSTCNLCQAHREVAQHLGASDLFIPGRGQVGEEGALVIEIPILGEFASGFRRMKLADSEAQQISQFGVVRGAAVSVWLLSRQ